MTHWPIVALFLLGAYHGVNPGMGWLFAVALGLQEKSRRAVLKALPPIAAGHLFSIGLVVAAVELFQARVPHAALRIAAAVVLIGFGSYRLVRARHPRWVGMRVGFRDLTVWSFLMASAHGAGLMLVPILLGWPNTTTEHHHHLANLAPPASTTAGQMNAGAVGLPWLVPVGIHTLGYLLVTSLVALLVYEKLGVEILRRAWLNLDLVWAIALVATGILTLFV